jgi:single-strand DNA-binding protein
MQINTFNVAGYLAASPKVRCTPKGTPVANARIGQTSRFKREDGTYSEHTNWFNLVFWGPVAQALADADLQKGANLWVLGSFEQRPYSRKKNPENKSTIYEVNVRRFFLVAPVSMDADRMEKQTVSAVQAPDSDGKEHWAPLGSEKETLSVEQ